MDGHYTISITFPPHSNLKFSETVPSFFETASGLSEYSTAELRALPDPEQHELYISFGISHTNTSDVVAVDTDTFDILATYDKVNAIDVRHRGSMLSRSLLPLQFSALLW